MAVYKVVFGCSKCCLVAALLVHLVWGGDLGLALHDDGSFSISLAGNPWLAGGEVRVGPLSSATGALVVVDSSIVEGSDPLGKYRARVFRWARQAQRRDILLETSFRTYSGDKGALVFEQRFPSELTAASGLLRTDLAASTLFPGFQRNTGPADGLECFSYHGVFPRMRACSVSSFSESHMGGTPLVVYNASDPLLPMVVFSPLNFPMAQHMATSKTLIGAGIKAPVQTIPRGWSQLFILSAGAGINDGMMAWGNRLLAFTSKPRTDLYRDEVLSTIGFWTDNGGYYHYSTGPRKDGKNYEEVLPKVKAYHESLGVHFRHWQFDSWFYPKDGPVDTGGGGGAVTNWTSLPSVFPHGMAGIQKKLGVPMVMHNRQWSTKSDYIQNLPFRWYVSEKAAVPADPLDFFSWFFKQQDGWGLATYEQDWMNKEYDSVDALQSNISLGDMWLHGMAEGAGRNNLTVQYCMPYANQVLSAAAYPQVTTARATDDYFHGPDQWAIGGTSLFYWAIGIIPFKDGFYSSTNRQVGGQTVGPEKDPDREALMSVLSGAMVGPMDGMGLLNASRVNRTCRSDGTLLKADKPLTTTDTCFRQGRPTCYIYHTYSDFLGYGKVHYLFSNDDPSVSADMAYISEPSLYALYNWYTGEVFQLQESNLLVAGYEGHAYAIIAPIRLGWVFVGEVEKYVTAARMRFASIHIEDDGHKQTLFVQAYGMAGESIKVCAARVVAWQVLCNTVRFVTDGSMNTTFSSKTAIGDSMEYKATYI